MVNLIRRNLCIIVGMLFRLCRQKANLKERVDFSVVRLGGTVLLLASASNSSERNMFLC